MKENVSFQIETIKFHGELTCGDGNENEIKCNLSKPNSDILQNMYQSESGCTFEFNGIIKNSRKFAALNCDVRNGIEPLAYKIFVKNDEKLSYKINIGSLYLGVSSINKTARNIKKCKFKTSHEIPFLKNIEQINVAKYNFNIKFCESIIIEFTNLVSLDELNQVLFDLKIFFQIVVLNKDIKIIEKYFFLEDETQVEEIKKYEKETNQKESIYLFKNDDFNIKKSLNLWFEGKEKYGKIFDYLSGILKETTLKHIEFKLFALSQWIEAYSREYLKNTVLQIINDSTINQVDKIFLKSISAKNNTFRTNLNGLFIIKNLDQLLFNKTNRNKRDYLISDIVCYRNNLTHLNVKDSLNIEQAVNLYELLKNFIYLFILQELEIHEEDKYKKEIIYYYNKYEYLSKIIKKCK